MTLMMAGPAALQRLRDLKALQKKNEYNGKLLGNEVSGRVAQRESTVLTSQGSLVQSQPCPLFFPSDIMDILKDLFVAIQSVQLGTHVAQRWGIS